MLLYDELPPKCLDDNHFRLDDSQGLSKLNSDDPQDNPNRLMEFKEWNNPRPPDEPKSVLKRSKRLTDLRSDPSNDDNNPFSNQPNTPDPTLRRSKRLLEKRNVKFSSNIDTRTFENPSPSPKEIMLNLFHTFLNETRFHMENLFMD